MCNPGIVVGLTVRRRLGPPLQELERWAGWRPAATTASSARTGSGRVESSRWQASCHEHHQFGQNTCTAAAATGLGTGQMTTQITPLVLSSGTSGSTPMAEPTTPVRSVTQPASLLIPGVLCAKPPQPAQINEMRQRMRTGEVFRTEILPSAADCPSRKVPNHRSRGIVASPCKTHSTHQFRLTAGTHTFAQSIHFRRKQTAI